MLSMILLLCPFMDVVRGDRDGSEEEFFYQASIKRDEKIVCGGTVINAYHVISVAHCFYNLPTHSKLPVDNIFAAAATPEDSEVVWVHAKVLIHERFAILSLDNDLEKKFAVDEKRFPLKINQDPIGEEDKCVLCGWEKATPREKRIKMEGFKCVDDVPLISREKCLKTPEYKSIAQQNFCAGDGGDAKFCHVKNIVELHIVCFI
ncbi:unnamed protein product [Brassicogethes aeneus]|uniref:Peptidase S1 domain-containing protein n=1 Tax=Brassicogethes aeneus TaxID=1431903 RepID=A0A9P0FJY1_BRAAE|nr:unnamed protein product [Brassicogethes aeneus]